MKVRSRIIIGFLVVIVALLYYLTDWILKDMRPHYLMSLEESLNDTATILSSAVAEASGDRLNVASFRETMTSADQRVLHAKIYNTIKEKLAMRVYITDDKGIVIFDSDSARDEGMDYSRWNDVFLTLNGRYGARTTRAETDDPTTSSYYVASPILKNDQILGVLTVSKPVQSVNLFFEQAKSKVVTASIIAGLCVIVLLVALSIWVTSPIKKLTRYANDVRDGKRVLLPRLGKGEIGSMGKAFEEMGRALEGKEYVERYVQTLTHEIKNPLSGIRGAAELLEEEMPAEDRNQFIQNIRSESARIQSIVDRMLQLAALENRKVIEDVEDIDLSCLVKDIIGTMSSQFQQRKMTIKSKISDNIQIYGDRFLIRQAVTNLIQNAVEFSPANTAIQITVGRSDSRVEVVVDDNGPGIPEYAKDKIFDRFYSLRRPDTQSKSTGLGLSFVQEVADLHHGTVTVTNRKQGGTRAVLVLPGIEPSDSASRA